MGNVKEKSGNYIDSKVIGFIWAVFFLWRWRYAMILLTVAQIKRAIIELDLDIEKWPNFKASSTYKCILQTTNLVISTKPTVIPAQLICPARQWLAIVLIVLAKGEFYVNLFHRALTAYGPAHNVVILDTSVHVEHFIFNRVIVSP